MYKRWKKLGLLAALLGSLSGAAGAQVTPPAPPESEKAAETTDHVQVKSIIIDGVGALLTPEELKEIKAPYEGKSCSLAELQELNRQITQKLKDKGYFLAYSVLPPQPLESGSVRYEVLPGKIGDISIKGNEHYTTELIRDHIEEALGEGRTLREADLQRALLILNENTDLKTRAQLKAGKDKGESDLEVLVTDALPIHGGVSYDNFGSRFTDIHRAGTHVDFGNLSGHADVLSLRALFGVPNNRASLLQAAYSLPVDADGTRLALTYANGASTLGQQLQIFDIRGRADIYSLAVSRPLTRTTTENEDVTFGYSYKDVNNSILGLSSSVDRYHSVRLGYSGDFQAIDGRTLVQLGLTQGLSSDTPAGLFPSRIGAESAFTKLNIDLARVQNVAEPLFFIFRAGGQIARTPLFAAEQYALGGADSVRGYSQAEFLGDSGYSFSAEMRWIPWDSRRDVQFAFFIDHGQASLLKPQPGEVNQRSLTGAGFGVRFNVTDNARFRLDVGFPISPSSNIVGDSPVFYGQIYTNF